MRLPAKDSLVLGACSQLLFQALHLLQTTILVMNIHQLLQITAEQCACKGAQLQHLHGFSRPDLSTCVGQKMICMLCEPLHADQAKPS